MLIKTRGKYCFGDEITAADLFFAPHVQGGSRSEERRVGKECRL